MTFLVEFVQIQEFARAVLDFPLHSNGLIDAPKDLADLVESTIGAVFMDCNSIDIVWEVCILLSHICTHGSPSLLVAD